MRLDSIFRSSAVALAVTMLAACGGGDGSPAVMAAPTVTSALADASVLTDATATFTLEASGTGLSYQWLRDGTPISGATAASYTTAPVTYRDHGAQFSVRVSNSGGSVTSNAATLSLKLSADQAAFEAVMPDRYSYGLNWNLNFSGSQTSGTNYAESSGSLMAASPLTLGPQTVTVDANVNLSSTLAASVPGPSRVLKDGRILVVPALFKYVVRYVGSGVQIDTLADDNTTIAISRMRSDFSTVALTGVLHGSTDDFAHYHNSFFSNPDVLNTTATYATGAAYAKYTEIYKGDSYAAFDCNGPTTGANISECFTNVTLDDALTGGMPFDGRTYFLSDGVVSTVGGIRMWVASAARPISATLSTSPQYRIFFQLNNNVYTGALRKDGSLRSTSYYVSNPAGATVTDRLTFLPFQIRMNKAARDSIAAAMAI